MGSSSRRWAALISFIASFILFFIIVFQFPLFRAPCRIGICKSPIMVISSQLMATKFCPEFVVKLLIYPGAIANAFINNRAIPKYRDLLKLCNLHNVKKGFIATDFHHLEILAGSYLTVAGAVLGVVRSGRMSLCGTLLIVWGFAREVLLRKHVMYAMIGFNMYPAMFIAVVCACLAIRKDVRMLIRSFRSRRAAKSVRFKAKSL